MSVSTNLSKTGSTVTGRFTLKNLPTLDRTEAAKPLYAVLGAADLALTQVKDVPADLSAEAKKAQALLAEVPAQVVGLPAAVRSTAHKAGQAASAVYAELTVRGERLASAIRRQPATEAAIAEGKEAVKKAEAATTAARKSAKAGEKAVEDAADKIG